MKTYLSILFLVVLASGITAQSKFEATNTAPGDFIRMGFLPRGMAMGNALSAVTTGNLSGFYNPAVSPFQEGNYGEAAYTFLSLDRHLNFLNFTKKFDFGRKDSNGKSRATAGLSLAIVNSGVSNIDGRSNDDFQTGMLSTSENLFFLSFANKFSKKLTIGLGARIYYYRLYDKVNTTATGFDLGAIYTVADNLKLAFVLQDLNSAYKWDTSPLYGTDGVSTTNKFPTVKKLGISYIPSAFPILLAAELEFNSYGRKLFRFGSEYEVYPGVFCRAGFDNWVLNNADELLQPSAGFSVAEPFEGVLLQFNYAFVVEQYSRTPRHSAGIGVIF